MRFVLFPLLLATALAQAQEPTGGAASNRYEVFTRAVLPLVQTFTPDNPQHALRLEGRLVSASGFDAKVAEAGTAPGALSFPNTRVALATEAPEKLRLEITWNGEVYTIVRDAQRVWATPGSRLQAMMDAMGKLPKPKDRYEIPPLLLPFELKQLALLPVLFQVADAGEVPMGASASAGTAPPQKARVLDVRLMPELARGIGAADITTRWWIRPDGTPAQIKITRPNGQITVALDKVQVGGAFPPETWQPTKAQSADVLELTPVQVKQLLDAAGKQAKPKKKKPQPQP